MLWWQYVPIRLVGNLVFHIRPCLLVWSNYRWFTWTTILTIGILYLLYVFTHNALLKYCHWYVYWNGKFGLFVKHLDHVDTCGFLQMLVDYFTHIIFNSSLISLVILIYSIIDGKSMLLNLCLEWSIVVSKCFWYANFPCFQGLDNSNMKKPLTIVWFYEKGPWLCYDTSIQ